MENGNGYKDSDSVTQRRNGQRVDIYSNGATKEQESSFQGNGVFVHDGETRIGMKGQQVQQEKDPRMATALQKHQFTILVLLFQILFFVIFGLFAKYDTAAMPNKDGVDDPIPVAKMYSMFQDTHVMIYIGFGFLMTFLRRYGFSALSINMLLAAFTIEYAVIVRGFMGHEFQKHGYFTIGLEQILTSDFAAAVVLISMGAMLGKLSPVQYIVMTIFEIPVALGAEHFVVHTLKINDVGGSIVVHAFGAYFGLACSKAFGRKEQRGHPNEGSNYHSDTFAMIGAIFLWVFWPSFNAAVAEPADAKHRAVLNTVLSLASCTVATFIVSQATDHHKKFEMVHVANSTLAGGVAIGTVANVCLSPLHAIIVGFIAGCVSVIGYRYITPVLSEKLGMHDTCGVHNLHGMPAVIAAFASVAMALYYNPEDYGKSLGTIYAGMKTEENKDGFDQTGQAVHQLAGLGVVLLAAIISGFITGFILKLKVWNQVREKEFYADADYFETPSDYDFTSRITSCIDHVDINERTPLHKEA
ncbi:unnamed protein product, partial [Mesorhabditis belari]|uniref:Ammonium transporter AmtB-like domain-containing protein n=1 Tax=Mesorhabditis belari TaxID=2138241 RepID=A0AAF3FUY9_9BILA